MALVPISKGHVALLTSVPFNNQYSDTRWFDSLEQQQSYFNDRNKIVSFTEFNVINRENAENYIKVPLSAIQCQKVNYLYFYNHDGVDTGKRYYAFVTKVEYMNAKTTKIHFQIDVIQTYMFNLSFKDSYIGREHTRQYEDDGKPTLNTVDEGIDYGTELQTNHYMHVRLNAGIKFLVLVAKQTLHNNSEDDRRPTSSVNGTPQPLSYYIVPFTDSDKPISVEDNVAGTSTLLSKATEVLDAVMNDEELVNQVAAMYVTEYFGVPVSGKYDIATAQYQIEFQPNNTGADLPVATLGEYRVLYVRNINKYEPMSVLTGVNINEYFPKYGESKFYMFPYSQLVLDDYKGSRTIYHPEYIDTINLRLVVRGSLGTSNNMSWSIAGYNLDIDADLEEDWLTTNIQHENSVINRNPQDVPVVSDYLAAYMQGNRNSIQNATKQATFNAYTGVAAGLAGGVAGGMMGGPAGFATAASGLMSGVQSFGNAYYKIKGLNAKQQDANNMPPNVSSMGSNTAYDVGNGLVGIYLIWKTAKYDVRRRIGSYFNMYGYQVNRVKQPNLKTRKSWNYIQMVDAKLIGSFNNEDMTLIKAVFENGITLWHTDNMLDYTQSNEVT